MVPGIQQSLRWKPELYLYPPCPEHGSTQRDTSILLAIHTCTVCPQILFTSLIRSIRASFCLTRMWKQESKWRSLGCRETPRRSIAPSGPPHPTPLTQCGMRSLLFSRRCVWVDKNFQIYVRVNVFVWNQPFCLGLVLLLLFFLIYLLLSWWIDPAPRNGLSKTCSPWRER